MMSRHRTSSRAGRAAEQRGIAVQGMRNAIAAAEVHRDRARAGIVRLEAQLVEREELGLADEAALAALAGLRNRLAQAEADITAARRSLGQERAA